MCGLCSLTGAVFLAAFGVWGGVSAVDARRGDGGAELNIRRNLRGRVAAGLWSFVAGLAGVVFVAQVGGCPRCLSPPPAKCFHPQPQM